MKRLISCASLSAILLVPACSQPSQTDQAGHRQKADTPQAPTWQYDESRDEMRGSVYSTATLQSMNQPDLKFPYEGGSPVYLRLSKSSDEPGEYAPEVVLENGQFDCAAYGGEGNSCLITIKADDQKPYDIRGVEVDCGSAKCMRLFDEQAVEQADDAHIYSRVFDVLKKSRKLTIELPLYEYGSYQYQFNVRNLHWEWTKGS